MNNIFEILQQIYGFLYMFRLMNFFGNYPNNKNKVKMSPWRYKHKTTNYLGVDELKETKIDVKTSNFM
jgi:hypothetical protein